jgi:hypothetical protein
MKILVSLIIFFAGTRGNGLEIAERLEIAIDIAHAVTYLHMYTGMQMI